MTTAYDVVCPECGAPVGESCWVAGTKIVRWPHKVRRRQAEAIDE